MGTYQVRDDYDGEPAIVKITSDRIIVTWPRQEGRKRGPSEIALTSVIDCGWVGSSTGRSYGVDVTYLDEMGSVWIYHWIVKNAPEMFAELDSRSREARPSPPPPAEGDGI